MTHRLSTFISATLMALLVLTGSALAMARGAGHVAGQMVICTGTGPVMVYLGELGQPTDPPVYCPDAVVSMIEDAVVSDLPRPQRNASGQECFAHLVALMSTTPHSAFEARAPPLSV